MNPSNSSYTLRTKESFAFPSIQSMLKEPMMKTPEKDRVFNPNELMNMPLIETPQDTEHLLQRNATSKSASDPSESSIVEKLSLRTKMVCHEDFPQLLSLLNQVKRANLSTKDMIERPTKDEKQTFATLMGKYGVKNSTLYRGQCPFTDSKMEESFSMLQYHLKMKADAAAITDFHGKSHSVAPPRLFTPRSQLRTDPISASKEQIQSNAMTTSDLISWSDSFLKTSPLLDHEIPAQEKKRSQSKNPSKNKTKDSAKNDTHKQRLEAFMMDTSSTPMGTEHKTTIGKKRCVEKSFGSPEMENNKTIETKTSLKLQRHPPINQFIAKPKLEVLDPIDYKHPSLSSPTATIATDVAVTLTPHPFKKKKTNDSPPSNVVSKYAGPLSDITCRSERSSIVFGRNIAGVRVATPRVKLFADGSRTAPFPDGIFSPLGVKDTNTDDHEKSLSTMKENHGPPIKKAFLKTIDELGGPAQGRCSVSGIGGTIQNKKNSHTASRIKKDAELNNTKSPHLFSVTFQQSPIDAAGFALSDSA